MGSSLTAQACLLLRPPQALLDQTWEWVSEGHSHRASGIASGGGESEILRSGQSKREAPGLEGKDPQEAGDGKGLSLGPRCP